METIVNIGTNKKNIVGVVFSKPFSEISLDDIMDVIRDRFGDTGNLSVYGWCDVTEENKTTD